MQIKYLFAVTGFLLSVNLAYGLPTELVSEENNAAWFIGVVDKLQEANKLSGRRYAQIKRSYLFGPKRFSDIAEKREVSYEVHEYESPKGFGYLIVLLVEMNGNCYRNVIDRGPEERSSGWENMGPI